MKDSEKEHRISSLKQMIDNVNEETEEDKNDDIEEDSELINYLNEEEDEFENLQIDDEYIYHPGDENNYNTDAHENPIDEEFLIKTPKVKDDEENNEIDEYSDTLGLEIGENFDSVVNAKIGKTPIIGIVSLILGIILLIVSIIIFQSRTDRLFDNVVSGETNFIFIIFLIIGIFFLIYGVFKVLNLKNPFSNVMEGIEREVNAVDVEENKEKPREKTIPPSEIPLDKESYKIGEFKMGSLQNSLEKPTASEENVSEEEIDDISFEEVTSKKEDEKTEEESEIEEVDNESIDEIFAEVDEIDKKK